MTLDQILHDEFVKPCQYHPEPNLSGQQNLLMALIADAMLHVTGQGSVWGHKDIPERKARLRYFSAVEALEWFLSNSEEPSSYLYCCEHLKLNPRLYRRKAECLFLRDWTPVDVQVSQQMLQHRKLKRWVQRSPSLERQGEPAWNVYVGMGRPVMGEDRGVCLGAFWSKAEALTAGDNALAKIAERQMKEAA